MILQHSYFQVMGPGHRWPAKKVDLLYWSSYGTIISLNMASQSSSDKFKIQKFNGFWIGDYNLWYFRAEITLKWHVYWGCFAEKDNTVKDVATTILVSAPYDRLLCGCTSKIGDLLRIFSLLHQRFSSYHNCYSRFSTYYIL